LGNKWYSSPLTGFDGNNNPVWGTQTMIATASTGALDPQNRTSSPSKQRPSVAATL